MTRTEFHALMGFLPDHDDLERANCPRGGTIGHMGCGICEHGKPVFLCHPCFIARATASPSTGGAD